MHIDNMLDMAIGEQNAIANAREYREEELKELLEKKRWLLAEMENIDKRICDVRLRTKVNDDNLPKGVE